MVDGFRNLLALFRGGLFGTRKARRGTTYAWDEERPGRPKDRHGKEDGNPGQPGFSRRIGLFSDTPTSRQLGRLLGHFGRFSAIEPELRQDGKSPVRWIPPHFAPGPAQTNRQAFR